MSRPRKQDRHLPPCVYQKHGSYWYVKGGKWQRLGEKLKTALAAYAGLQESAGAPGGMPELIDEALLHILKGVKPSTGKQYRLAAKILKRKLVQFAPHQVQARHVAQLKRDLARTPNMANRCLSVLRQVLDYALEQQLVDTNPATGIRRHKEAKRTRLLSLEEYAAIHRHAGDRLQVIMDLCIRTGERISDVLKIRRADLTEEGIRFVQTKTGAKRIVPWTPDLKAVVARARKLYGNLVAVTLLHNRRGKAPDYSTVKLQWSKACAAAGVEDAHLHDLRAFAATWAKKQGKDPTALLGHTSPAQTRRYLRDKEEVIAEGPTFDPIVPAGPASLRDALSQPQAGGPAKKPR